MISVLEFFFNFFAKIMVDMMKEINNPLKMQSIPIVSFSPKILLLLKSKIKNLVEFICEFINEFLLCVFICKLL